MNLFLELRRHARLADKRHPMYDKSRFARFWIYLGAVFWAGYLIFIGTTLAFGLEDAPTEPYHILNSGLAFILALDFLLRFPLQRTPTQEVKPYLLLPVRRGRLIDFLLVRSGLSGINFIWLFLFLPFALLTVTKFYGLWGVLAYCVGIWLLMMLNNYWYLLCRTLLGERIWWVLLPVGVYAALGLGMFLPEDSPVFDWFRDLGEGFITGNAPAFLGVLAAIALLWWVDSRVIRRLIYNELNKTEDTTVQVKTLSEYKFLDRYGMTGEYMRLELKLMLRNKMCRKSLISIVVAILLFSALISFTDVYQLSDFWVMYNYVIVSLLAFSTLMGYEGNYMDGLMTRRESLFALLRAKYLQPGPPPPLRADADGRGDGQALFAANTGLGTVHGGTRQLRFLPNSRVQQPHGGPQRQDDRPQQRGHGPATTGQLRRLCPALGGLPAAAGALR